MAAEPRTMPAPVPPPRSEVGVVGWAYANLFNSWYNSALTFVAGAAVTLGLWFGLRWMLLSADWNVISQIGGLFVIGQYNTDQACPGNNCFWRPQAALLLVTMLLGMVWVAAGGGVARRIAMMVAVAAAAFAFLPYSLERMGLDVRLLLLANLPALALGWALARYTPLGTTRWIAILGVLTFLVTLLLLKGLEGVPGLQPVALNDWGGLMLNLLLAVAGIVLSMPIGTALAWAGAAIFPSSSCCAWCSSRCSEACR